MDPETLLLLALIGGAAYLYFQGSPSSSVAMPPASLTPATTTTPTTTPTTAPALNPGTTIPASSAQAPGGGTTVAPKAASVPSDQTFLNQVAPVDPAGAKDWATASWEAQYLTLSMMQQMRLTASATDSGCSSFSSSNVTFQEASGIGMEGASVAAAFVPVIGPFVAIGGAIVGLVQNIFAAHKKKVAEQAQLDCAGVAAANNVLDEIDSALASGSLTPAQAKAGWEAVYSQFQQTVAPMIKDDSSHCNGPCILLHVLRAILNKYEYIYGV